MRRGWRQLLGILAIAGLVPAGCTSTSTCGKGPCPTATFNLRALDDSTVTWTFSQLPAQTSTGFVTGEPSVGQCRFDYQGVVFQSGVELAAPGPQALACNGESQQLFDYLGFDLGDPRAWSVGSFTLLNRACPTECSSCNPAAGPTGKPCLNAVLDSVNVKVVVETAIGGAAPRPKLVTDDFVRTFRLELDTSAATARTSTGEVCDYPVTEKVSLHLTQTAADYVYDAEARCPC